MKNYNSKKLALLLAANIHGSGIDYDYIIEETRKYIVLKNSVHCMDESGYYDGCIDFSVLIDKKTTKVYKIKFHYYDYHLRKYKEIYFDYLKSLYFDPMFYFPYSRPYYVEWNIK